MFSRTEIDSEMIMKSMLLQNNEMVRYLKVLSSHNIALDLFYRLFSVI